MPGPTNTPAERSRRRRNRARSKARQNYNQMMKNRHNSPEYNRKRYPAWDPRRVEAV